MKKSIRPYIFWIVIGVVLVVELALFAAVYPTDAKGVKDARQVKTALDTEYRNLKDLQARAANKSPVMVVDPLSEQDLKDLQTKYLQAPTWAEPLRAAVAKWGQQIFDIRSYLARRSAWLHRPVDDSGDKLRWYSRYEEQTIDLLKQLNENGCILLPAAGTGPATGTAKAEDPAAQFKEGRAVRDVAGFYTRETEFPLADEWPLLTMRLRAMEHVIRTIIAVRVDGLGNPIAAPAGVAGGAQQNLVAQLTRVEWADPKSAEKFSDSTKDLVRTDKDSPGYVRVSLTFQGHPSALLAVHAGLEQNREADRPITVVVGGTLKRKEAFAAGERKDAPSEAAVLTMDLVFLDFLAPPAAVPVAPTAPAPAGKGGGK